MNARLQEETRDEGEGGDKELGTIAGGGRGAGGNMALGDERQQQGRCTDSLNWIGKASGYADFAEPRRGQTIGLSPESSYASATRPDDDTRVLPADVAAPSSSVTSQLAGDNGPAPRARDIETPRWAPARLPLSASCNLACNFAPAACNNVVPLMTEQALFRDVDDGQSAGPHPSDTCAFAWRNCPQLLPGPVDVEDLAIYFDPSADNGKPPTSGRAIYSRRPRYGQGAARMLLEQPRSQEPRCERLDVASASDLMEPYYNSSRFSYPAEAGDPAFDALPRPCEVGPSDPTPTSTSTPTPTPRSCALQPDFYGQQTTTCEPRLACAAATRELDIRELNRRNLEHDGAPAAPADDWSCYHCPELFNFCSEQRWLQCPASDRCPLYDNSYDHGAPLSPPCLYENLYEGYDGNDNWRYDYAEDEQLLEDYLSNEKRKERSRDAARYRRSRETDIFADLAAVLPVAPQQAAHLDKASVMRLAIAYLKVRAVVDSIPASVTKSESSTEMDDLFPKALNGFMLVLSSDGNMVYLSENVSDYLGVSQMDMMGQSVYEYSHPCDHDELRECLSSKLSEKNGKRVYSFFLRLKCTLTSKGRKVNLKSASYKVIHCTGRLTTIRDSNSNSMEVDNEEGEKEDEEAEREANTSLVLVGNPIPHPSNIEIPLGRHTFLSKHNLSMKFTYADEKLAEYLGWDSEDLMGRSVFEFYHALDNLALDKCFKCLFSKGQCETVAYRFLGKRGGYAWVVTQATLIHCSKQQKPISVVCVNYILR
ncbi:Hypoxia-inducible factor 1 alpha [Harpegnathos saltator]|uniref:Hypoxia-inducible factor 1 alpha n=1 Tax=Harpegnathos saltator TaxID=610380 RepID=E2C8J9_HARSA|nr:Hypoxia-inducible factor 1 alpha [Harpegnathos saltator]